MPSWMIREWTEILLGCSGIVGRPSQMSRSDRDALPYVCQLSGGLSGCSVVVDWPPGFAGMFGRPSRMSGSGRDALSNVWEWLRGPPKCP